MSHDPDLEAFKREFQAEIRKEVERLRAKHKNEAEVADLVAEYLAGLSARRR